MSLEIPFEMRNLTSFQMEKLCYDLRFKVLKEMDAEDTVQLVKVNAEFQSMLSRNPWVVFDHHVHRIDLEQWEKVFLQKLPVSSLVEFDATHLPLGKRIHSCDELWIDWRQKEVTDEFVVILNQLQSVKTLYFDRKSGGCFTKFLENFHARVEESVQLPEDMNLRDQVVSQLFDNFIANQANDCEKFLLDCWGPEPFHCYYDAFAKTSIKFFEMYVSLDAFEEMVELIVKKQIPIKSLKAAVYLPALYSQEVNARIVDFLSQFRGMRRFDGKIHQEVIELANEIVKKHRKGAFEFMNGIFFQRNIDSSKDCVYMLQSDAKRSTYFLAFYVQPQMEMMQF